MDIRDAKKLKQRLVIEKAFGVDEIPLADWRAAVQGRPAPAAKEPEAKRPQAATKTNPAWDKTLQEALGCQACRLSKTRTNVVFGEGSVTARLMFIGEAPGAEEDKQGRPFVGRAGQLLTKIIEAMGLRREEVYIANTLKCRPPENRPPEPDEIASCETFLKRQIAMIQPLVICTLGKFASQSVLRTDTPITKLRGHFQDWNGIKLMPTYHPAYLLRNPAEKKTVWSDMQQIMAELGLPKKE